MEFSKLLKVEQAARDEDWEKNFLNLLPQQKVQLQSPDPQVGADSWPYLFVSTTLNEGGPSVEQVQILDLIGWLSTRGVGLALNPQLEVPDYILSYGQTWFFRQTGKLYASATSPSGNGQIVHAGTPTQEFFPDYARKIVREFLRDQGVYQPKILLVSDDRVHYDLAFSAESLGSPPQKEWEGIIEGISWFFPNHYSLVLTSEKGLPPFQEF